MRVAFRNSTGKVNGLGIETPSGSRIYYLQFIAEFPPPSPTKVLARKKNWNALGPDRLSNFWWKKAKVLHEGVAMSFQTIANTNVEYSAWFFEGKTTLLPKPGEFTIDNESPITCLNTLYKSCLLGPTV